MRVFVGILLFVSMGLVPGAELFRGGEFGGAPGEYIEGDVGNVRVQGGALVFGDRAVGFKAVPVLGGKAYRLSFRASFRGDVESIEDNARFDLLALPGERNGVLPYREMRFFDEGGEAVGRSLVLSMPFRAGRGYVDVFHVPAGAVVLRLTMASGAGVTVELRDLKLEAVGGSEVLNLNPEFGLGRFNYSGWQNISAGGKLIERGGKTVLDTKYGSRGSEFPLAGPGTYALSATATGNGYNSTVHLDVFGADGTKLMRASLRRFGEANYFVVPEGAVSGSLLVYSCLLEEVRVRRVGDEGAIEVFNRG